MPALAAAQHDAVGQRPHVDDAEVLTAAGPADQPGLLPIDDHFMLANPGHYRLLICSSDSRSRGRGGSFASVPGTTTPCTDAATAQPTTQSSQ